MSVPSPGNVVSLLTLVEIHERWGKNVETVYRAVRDGRLHAYGRTGHQKYYSERELMQVFGEPPNGTQPPSVKAPRKSAWVDGRQLSWPELTGTAAAA